MLLLHFYQHDAHRARVNAPHKFADKVQRIAVHYSTSGHISRNTSRIRRSISS